MSRIEDHPLRHRRRHAARYASNQQLMTRVAVVMSLLFALSMVLSHLTRPAADASSVDAKIETVAPPAR